MVAYTERLHPKGVPISSLLEYERVVISLVEVHAVKPVLGGDTLEEYSSV